jgi:lipoprotein-releasing system permease protein
VPETQRILKLAPYIAKRVAFSKQKSFSGFITKLSIIATTLSVATMIITLAVIYGFQGAISDKVFSFWGHIRVKSYENAKSVIAEESFITKNDTVVAAVQQHPNVRSISAYARKSAILTTNTEFDGLLMKGVEKNFDTTYFKKFMTAGRWLHFNDSSFSKEIVISQHTAKTLKANINDRLIVYFFDSQNEKTRAKSVTVVGLYKTDIDEYDRSFFIGDLNLIRDLNFWDSTQIGGYEIFVKNIKQLDATNDTLNKNLSIEWQSKTIKEEYGTIFEWLALLDINKYLLIAIMSIVAAVNLITCLIILVLERIRMVGILKALGTEPKTIRRIFVYHTLYIAISGIVLGVLLGAGICLVQQKTGWLKLSNTEAYSISVVPIDVLWWHIPLIALGTLVFCFLVLLVPAFIINKIKPVDAIKFT